MEAAVRFTHNARGLPLLGHRTTHVAGVVANSRASGTHPRHSAGRTFARRVSSARRTAGLTEEELAALVGVFGEDVVAIEAGRLLPAPPLALAISGAVGCPSLLRAYMRERRDRIGRVPADDNTPF
jgi:DNA-binding XRE family transcriptional regulator